MERPRVERRLAAFMTVGRIVAEPIFLRTLFSWGDGGRSDRVSCLAHPAGRLKLLREARPISTTMELP
jgi:hypothetical protein